MGIFTKINVKKVRKPHRKNLSNSLFKELVISIIGGIIGGIIIYLLLLSTQNFAFLNCVHITNYPFYGSKTNTHRQASIIVTNLGLSKINKFILLLKSKPGVLITFINSNIPLSSEPHSKFGGVINGGIGNGNKKTINFGPLYESYSKLLTFNENIFPKYYNYSNYSNTELLYNLIVPEKRCIIVKNITTVI